MDRGGLAAFTRSVSVDSVVPRIEVVWAKGYDEAHPVSLATAILNESQRQAASMILTYRYRLLPTKTQHRALEAILESQRQLYNAALEERIDAYRKAKVTRTYFDQTKALTEWRQDDPEASALPVGLQRATLKRLDEAYRAFFRRVKSDGKPGFPRFRSKGWFDGFGFREFCGISMQADRLRFKGMPEALRVHLHRPIPAEAVIRSCVFRRDVKGWMVGLAAELPPAPLREGERAVGCKSWYPLDRGGSSKHDSGLLQMWR